MKILSVIALSVLPLCSIAIQARASSSEPVSVSRIWARATPDGASTGVVYMTISSLDAQGDRLVGASTPAARLAQLHQTLMQNGVMKMREIKGGLRIPPGGVVSLKPGGDHLMLVGLAKPLRAGASFPLTLDFAKAGKMSVTVPVLPITASGPAASEKMGRMEMK